MVQTINAEVRERLQSLLQVDLAFLEGERKLIHGLHAFAAKFPPQLPRYFIEGLTQPGDTVLDPMAGSGVTLIEAWLLSRNAIGVDLDPLALLLSSARTRQYDVLALSDTGHRVLNEAQSLLQSHLGNHLWSSPDDRTKNFVDYWFEEETQRQLGALLLAIESQSEDDLRDLLKLLFSSTIVTKSGGVSKARDLAHSRPHKVLDKTPKDALLLFKTQLNRAIRAFQEIEGPSIGRATVLPGDSRKLPVSDEAVDLIVTSPPYANALDYMRAHKFSLAWLGYSISDLGSLRSQYIGSENCKSIDKAALPEVCEQTISNLALVDPRKARVLRKYLADMRLAIAEMFRVLRSGHTAIIVVGPSIMRGLLIPTHEHLASIAATQGFEVVGIVQRPIDRNRRMMPMRSKPDSTSLIEQRMHEEYVIGLYKN